MPGASRHRRVEQSPTRPAVAGGRRPSNPLSGPRHIAARVAPPLLTLVVLLAVWVFLAGRYSPHILPGPDRVWSAFLLSWQQDLIQPAIVTTLTEALVGWLIGSCLALPVGYMLSRSKFLDDALSPYLAASQVVPVIALAPLLFLWLGFGLELKIVLAAVIAFFPVAATTASGLRSIPKDLRDVARAFGANWRQTVAHVELPLAAPSILAGERIAITLAVTGAFVGEFVNPDQGLGALVLNNMQQFDTALVFVCVIALMVIGAALYSAVSVAERTILRWSEE
jgi:NitT/TauT family transport system permease protein